MGARRGQHLIIELKILFARAHTRHVRLRARLDYHAMPAAKWIQGS
jgi:hypothetical protein